MKMALVQEPIKIPLNDSQALMLHAEILMIRSLRYELLEKDVEIARQKLVEAEFQCKRAKLELELFQLNGERLLEQEKGLVNKFFTQVRKTTPQMRTLQERYGDGVRFIFDSDNKEVWLVVVFSHDAPPILQEEEHFAGEEYDIDDGEDEPEDVPGEV